MPRTLRRPRGNFPFFIFFLFFKIKNRLRERERNTRTSTRSAVDIVEIRCSSALSGYLLPLLVKDFNEWRKAKHSPMSIDFADLKGSQHGITVGVPT